MMGLADLPVEAFQSIKTKALENHNHRADSTLLADHESQTISSTISLPIMTSEVPEHHHKGLGLFHHHSNDTSIDATVTTSKGISDIEPKTVSAWASTDTESPDLENETVPSRIERATSTSSNHSSITSTSPSSNLGPYRTESGGKGRIRERNAAHVAEAVLKIPMDLSSSIAQGFHNAPRLYGDHTVRASENITGFQSGIKAAGKDLALGFYDGISGFVTQPIRGAKENGVAGLLSGVVKGVGGLVLKPAAGKYHLESKRNEAGANNQQQFQEYLPML